MPLLAGHPQASNSVESQLPADPSIELQSPEGANATYGDTYSADAFNAAQLLASRGL